MLAYSVRRQLCASHEDQLTNLQRKVIIQFCDRCAQAVSFSEREVPVCEVLLNIRITIGFQYLSSKFARFLAEAGEITKKI